MQLIVNKYRDLDVELFHVKHHLVGRCRLIITGLWIRGEYLWNSRHFEYICQHIIAIGLEYAVSPGILR